MTSAHLPRLPAQVSPPEFALSEHLPHTIHGADVVGLPVFATEDASATLGTGAEELGASLGVDLLAVLAAARGRGLPGEVVSYPVPDGTPANAALRLVVLVGAGSGDAAELRRAGAAFARAVRGRGLVATSLPTVDADRLTAFVEGVMLGSFVFSWRSAPAPEPPVRRVVLAGVPGPAGAEPGLRRAVALGGAGWRSRMVATVPSNLKDPPWLAEQAEEIAAEAGLGVRVWDERQLADGGFGGILGVGQGSASPPRLIRLDYRPRRRARKAPTVVLVGKGITFDTGGLSIKPGEAMATMKRDVTGGAVVLATMAALRDVACPVRVVGLVPAAENAVSGTAIRPGDVVRHVGGRTTEVTNTDAEGRLVLADAIAYAVAELAPAVIVDVATLTGAAKVALGQQVAALFATDDGLADRLTRAGEEAGEPLWRLPLFAGYEDRLASKVADADNAPGGPGAITAALFLRHFVGDVPWAHLDLAPVGDVPEDRHEWTAGPSGFGARLLLRWLGAEEPLTGIGAGADAPG